MLNSLDLVNLIHNLQRDWNSSPELIPTDIQVGAKTYGSPRLPLDAFGKSQLDQKRQDSQPLRTAEERVEAPGGTPSTQMRQVELSEVVREALEELGDDQRVAVLLSKFEDMSYGEIAEIMGRSEAAVKSLLARARANLRERLEPYLRTGQRSG